MKEITVTFENGAIFNGSANIMTLNGETTYYFQADKYYRVQLNALSAITMQEYQNTNGAWYPIDIITKVVVEEVENKNAVTKDYLEDNYYNKTQTDNRFVLKSGDTMTGNLKISYDNQTILLTSNYINISENDETYMQINKSTIHIYEGNIYFRNDTKDIMSTVTMSLTGNGITIKSPDNNIVCTLMQEKNFTSAALHLYNGGRVLVHSGESGTTEQYIQFTPNGFTQYNAGDTGAIRFYSPVIMERQLTTNAQFNGMGGSYFRGLIIRNGYSIQVGEDASYTSIGSETINIYNNSNTRFGLTYNGAFIWNAGQKTAEFSNSRGLELYGGKAVILHNDYNIQGKHTAYNWNGLNGYNFTNSDNWNFYLNNATIQAYCYRFLVYANVLARIQATNNDVVIAGSEGYVSANNAPKALNNEFYSQNFLNALNLFLENMQDNIRTAAPGYSTVNEVSFSGETFGGGFQAGGGSSRGGGVGRRSIG